MHRSKFGGLLWTMAAASLLVATTAASEVYDTGDPYDGQEITHSPSRVLIRFTEPVRMEKAILVDEAGRNIDVRFGIPEDEAADSVLVRVPEILPPGKYQLHWLAYVPGHRHSDDGTVRFTVLPPQAQSSQAQSSQAQSLQDLPAAPAPAPAPAPALR